MEIKSSYRNKILSWQISACDLRFRFTNIQLFIVLYVIDPDDIMKASIVVAFYSELNKS